MAIKQRLMGILALWAALSLPLAPVSAARQATPVAVGAFEFTELFSLGGE